MTTRIWLIRHGEPADVRGRCYGKLDVGLSATGRNQMERVAAHLREEPFGTIYASPRLRTTESARILAASRDCLYEEVGAFREIDFGDFEGMTYDAIAARYPEIYRKWMEAPTEVQFPNGESFAEMRRRVLRAFEQILLSQAGKTAAIVTHGGVIRILITWALEMPDRCLFRLAQNYAAMNLLTWIDGVPQAQSINSRA